MSDVPFHDTRLGVKFFQHTLPDLSDEIGKLHGALSTVAAALGVTNQRMAELVTERRKADVDGTSGNERTGWMRALTQIAQRHLQIETLEERGAESLDVHEIDVTALRLALTAAYRAGIAAGIRHVVMQT